MNTSINFISKLMGLIALGVSVFFPLAARADEGVPDFILEFQGQPAIAVFEDPGESYALGCPKLRKLWSGVPAQRVTSAKAFNRIVGPTGQTPVVADIPCNASVKPYAPQGEPGAVVIRHRNGKFYRHYVDSIEFFTAIGTGDTIPIPREEFYEQYPDRATDFKVRK